jgi:hypothetical protein
MRVLRAKSVRKNLKFYKLVFGIDAPYNVRSGRSAAVCFASYADINSPFLSLLR